MCGLYGWYFKEAPKKQSMRTLAALLMAYNDSRGGDSWGYYDIDSDQRKVGLGDSVNMSQKTLSQLAAARAVIGHTRKATTGKTTLDNCHPFDVGNIVGAHNGMVFNHWQLNAIYDRDCNVDSQHIFHHLNENGELSEIESYGAIAFHSRERKTDAVVYLGCFNEGELAIAKLPHGIVWSSDVDDLELALHLAGWSKSVIVKAVDGQLLAVDHDCRIYECGELDFDVPSWGVSAADKEATGSSSSGKRMSDMTDKEFAEEDARLWQNDEDDWDNDSYRGYRF